MIKEENDNKKEIFFNSNTKIDWKKEKKAESLWNKSFSHKNVKVRVNNKNKNHIKHYWYY